jgi:hypothetical protein
MIGLKDCRLGVSSCSQGFRVCSFLLGARDAEGPVRNCIKEV